MGKLTRSFQNKTSWHLIPRLQSGTIHLKPDPMWLLVYRDGAWHGIHVEVIQWVVEEGEEGQQWVREEEEVVEEVDSLLHSVPAAEESSASSLPSHAYFTLVQPWNIWRSTGMRGGVHRLKTALQFSKAWARLIRLIQDDAEVTTREYFESLIGSCLFR